MLKAGLVIAVSAATSSGTPEGEAPGVGLGVRDDDATVHLFGEDWHAVDRARASIAAAGLDARVVAHHVDALRLARGAAPRLLRML